MARGPVIPSFFAPDMEQTLAFYTGVLGFSQTGCWTDKEETVWAELALGDAKLWFFRHALDQHPDPVFSGLVYIFIEDVDEMANQLHGKVDIEWGPESQEYGLRELGIKDNNGYFIVFAKDMEIPKTAGKT